MSNSVYLPTLIIHFIDFMSLKTNYNNLISDWNTSELFLNQM